MRNSEIRIMPSILNADRNDIQGEISKIAGVSDFIHLDIMDDIFVPNMSWNFDAASEIIRDTPIGIDAHLMVVDVDRIAIEYAEAGAASVTIHAEASLSISSTLRALRKRGVRSGLAIKPATEIEFYADLIDDIDMFLIMTVEPGYGGQKFMSEMMEKVGRTRSIIGSRPIWLQVDGGISMESILIAREAGADTFVAGSAVFSAPDPAEMVKNLRHLATSVQ
jgi:ribulose-phosphate 3-epimerase